MLDKHKDDNTDASRLTPAAMSEENDYIASLKDEMKRIDEDLTEAEAKNRLYYLLGERTRCACMPWTHTRTCVLPTCTRRSTVQSMKRWHKGSLSCMCLLRPLVHATVSCIHTLSQIGPNNSK